MMLNSFGLSKLAHVLLNIPALSQVIKKQASLKESLIKSFNVDLIEGKKHPLRPLQTITNFVKFANCKRLICK